MHESRCMLLTGRLSADFAVPLLSVGVHDALLVSGVCGALVVTAAL